MDENSYSVREARAKFSSLLREVRAGATVVITVHGKPVAELRPLKKRNHQPSLTERIEDLTAQGIVVPPSPSSRATFRVGVRKRGALARFLNNRG